MRTSILCSLALFLLPFGCNDDSPSSDGSDAGVVTLPDGAVTLRDGAALPPGNDGSVPPGDDDDTDGGNPGNPPGPGASGCQPLTVTAGATVDGAKADTFTWYDAACAKRIVPLIRNDASGALGAGGFARSFTYDEAGKTHVCKGTGANGWQGFGYIVSHYGPPAGNGGTAGGSNGVTGKYKTVLAGAHHAIHEFKWRINAGGAIDVTVHWFFATGRSHPVFAVSHDTTPAGKDVVNADARSPYGDVAFDEGNNAPVDGDGWGDKYKFVTTESPVTLNTKWDYTQPNIVPYVLEWSNSADAEMALVQTQSWADKEAGGDYGGPQIKADWGKTGSPMPQDWQWPYQLNNYELPYVNYSHRIAWGESYGAVGKSSYQAFGKTYSGYPYQSYSVYVVLGRHSAKDVAGQVGEIERVQNVKLTATRGTVATSGPRLAATDTVPFTPAGFDPVYGAWTVDAASDAATIGFDAGAGTLTNPIFVLRGYAAATPPATVTYGGKALVADTDYFATVDAAGKRLWITLNATVTGSGVLAVN